MSELGDEALIYAEEEPDITILSQAFTQSVDAASWYITDCERSYRDRRETYVSDDMRKNGPNAFPWDGASDQRVNVVGQRLDDYVAIFSQASERSHIKAFPTSTMSMARASTVSSFLKYMSSDYIPNLREQDELAYNFLLEKGIMIQYVGWKREQRSFLQSLTLDEIAEANPDLADLFQDPNSEELLIDVMKSVYPGITTGRAKKALRQLRNTGEAEIPVRRQSVDCPVVYTCAPDGDVFLPSYVTDPQRSPYIFWRVFLTAQELEKKVTSEGWDRQWVDYAIENLRGVDSWRIDGDNSSLINSQRLVTNEDELVMVVFAFQRLIDEVDGSEGIYQTVFNPRHSDGYAKKELLNGHDDYPFIFTRLSEDQKRFYETQPMTWSLRGPQFQIKTERDSRIDRASMATLPPLMHPAGRPPTDWGPGRKIPYRRLGEIAYGPSPAFDPGSIEIDQTMTRQADRAVGLDMESPLANVRQQFFVNKVLRHKAKVLALAWKLFQRMGPDEVFFMVSGSPDPQKMEKGTGDEDFRITIAYDTQSSDPETAEKKTEQIISLASLDRNGRMDMDKLLEVAMQGIDPALADYVLQPKEEAQEKMLRDVTDDLTKIFAGIEVPARPNGAQMSMQIVEQYSQQPDIAQRIQADPAFGERLKKYYDQNAFVIQQAQNAQTGKIGTPPAAIGQAETQGMEQ